jgi:hypothetical protein
MFDPLENVVMTVITSEFARGQTNLITEYDPLDLTDPVVLANVVHGGVRAVSFDITNPGIGYYNPTLIFTNAYTGDDIPGWAATASLDGNGSITAINITSAGSPFSHMNIRIEQNITKTTTSTVNTGTNTISVNSPSGILPGQRVIADTGEILGIVVGIAGNLVTLDRTLVQKYLAPLGLTFEGVDFSTDVNYEVNTASSVFVDRQFAEEFLDGFVPYTIVDANFVEVNNVDFVGITNTLGADVFDAYNFFVVNPDNGFDVATNDGDAGSWDLPTEILEETIVEQVAPNSREVRHRIHMDVFGGTDYLRITNTRQTVLTQDLYSWSEDLYLEDDSWLPGASLKDNKLIWVGTELIAYGRKNDTRLDFLTRGVKGTTIQFWPAGTPIYSALEKDLFNDLMPSRAVWLEVGTRYGNTAEWDSAADVTLGIGNDNVWLTLQEWDENSNTTVQNDTALVTNTQDVSSNLNMTAGSLTAGVNDAVRVMSQLPETFSLSNQASLYESILQLGTGNISTSVTLGAQANVGATQLEIAVGTSSVAKTLITENGFEIGQVQVWGGSTIDLYHPLEVELANSTVLTSTDIVNGMEIRDSANVIGRVVGVDYTTGNVDMGENFTYNINFGTSIDFYLRDVVIVENITGVGPLQVLQVKPSTAPGYSGYLNRKLFADSGTVDVSSIVVGNADGAWDSATITGQTALSLADRANADFSNTTSIMRFLHEVEDDE